MKLLTKINRALSRFTLYLLDLEARESCRIMVGDCLKYRRYADKREQDLLCSMLETLKKGGIPGINDMGRLYDMFYRPNDFADNNQDWGF